MPHTARLFFHLDASTARSVAGALAPDSGALSSEALEGAPRPEMVAEVPKSRARIAVEAEGVLVEVEAADLSSLRAAVNSYLRWVDAAGKAARLARP